MRKEHEINEAGKETWLNAALYTLRKQGVEGVKILTLSRLLGVTRTGFYWHFENRQALLDAMLDQWESKNTGNLTRRAEAFGESLNEAIFNVYDCWLDDDLFDGGLDLAIRSWARNDAGVRRRLDAADRARQAALEAMFARFGMTSEQAYSRAMSMLYTQIGYLSMRINEPVDLRVARMPAYAEILSGAQPTLPEINRLRGRHALPQISEAALAPRSPG